MISVALLPASLDNAAATFLQHHDKQRQIKKKKTSSYIAFAK